MLLSQDRVLWLSSEGNNGTMYLYDLHWSPLCSDRNKMGEATEAATDTALEIIASASVLLSL